MTAEIGNLEMQLHEERKTTDAIKALDDDLRAALREMTDQRDELLAVCQALVAWHVADRDGAYGTPLFDVVREARAAIAKIVG